MSSIRNESRASSPAVSLFKRLELLKGVGALAPTFKKSKGWASAPEETLQFQEHTLRYRPTAPLRTPSRCRAGRVIFNNPNQIQYHPPTAYCCAKIHDAP